MDLRDTEFVIFVEGNKVHDNSSHDNSTAASRVIVKYIIPSVEMK